MLVVGVKLLKQVNRRPLFYIFARHMMTHVPNIHETLKIQKPKRKVQKPSHKKDSNNTVIERQLKDFDGA